MTDEEMKLFREVKAFFETPAGRRLERFRSLYSKAVLTDAEEHAPLDRMRRCWAASDEALRELREEIQRLQSFEPKDG